MSKISSYYEKKQWFDQLAKEIQDLEQDKELGQEFEVLNKLKDIKEKHDVSFGHMAELLYREDPTSVQKKLASVLAEAGGENASRGPSGRTKRRMMRFTNPHTGETIETRGGNQKQLNAWRQKYGKEEVDGWKEYLE